MVIDFPADGTVEALYSDKFPLAMFGQQHVTRASEIKFNADTQTWTIFLPEGDTFVEIEQAQGFFTYEEARQMEVRWLDACRLHDIPAASDEGRALLTALRSMEPATA